MNTIDNYPKKITLDIIAQDLLTIVKKTTSQMIQNIATDHKLSIDNIDNLINNYITTNNCKNELNEKSIVIVNRCKAKKKNGTQCKRKLKSGDKYCGVHQEKRSYGDIVENNNDNLTKLWFEKIGNKLYLLDSYNNVYENVSNPILLGIYRKNKIVYF